MRSGTLCGPHKCHLLSPKDLSARGTSDELSSYISMDSFHFPGRRLLPEGAAGRTPRPPTAPVPHHPSRLHTHAPMFSEVFVARKCVGPLVGVTVEAEAGAGAAEGRKRSGGAVGHEAIAAIVADVKRALPREMHPSEGALWSAKELPTLAGASADDELSAILDATDLPARRSVSLALVAFQVLTVVQATLDIAHVAAKSETDRARNRIAVIGGGSLGELLVRLLAALGTVTTVDGGGVRVSHQSLDICLATAHPLRAEYDDIRDARTSILRDPTLCVLGRAG
jgi:hypothetical protein